jgi:hypothetical protein
VHFIHPVKKNVKEAVPPFMYNFLRYSVISGVIFLGLHIVITEELVKNRSWLILG